MWRQLVLNTSIGNGIGAPRMSSWRNGHNQVVSSVTFKYTDEKESTSRDRISWRRFIYDKRKKCYGEVPKISHVQVNGDLHNELYVRGTLIALPGQHYLCGISCDKNEGSPRAYCVITDEQRLVIRSIEDDVAIPTESMLGYLGSRKLPFVKTTEGFCGLFTADSEEDESSTACKRIDVQYHDWPEYIVRDVFLSSFSKWKIFKDKTFRQVGPAMVVFDFQFDANLEVLYADCALSVTDLREFLENGRSKKIKISIRDGAWVFIESFPYSFADTELSQRWNSSINNASIELCTNYENGVYDVIVNGVDDADVAIPLFKHRFSKNPFAVKQAAITWRNESFGFRKFPADAMLEKTSPLIWFSVNMASMPAKPQSDDQIVSLCRLNAEFETWGHSAVRDVYFIELNGYNLLTPNYQVNSFTDIVRASVISLAREFNIEIQNCTFGGESFGAATALLAAMAVPIAPKALILRNGCYNRYATSLGFQSFPFSIAERPDVYEEFHLVGKINKLKVHYALIESSREDVNHSTAPWQSSAFHDLLFAYGVNSTLLHVADSGHHIENSCMRGELLKIEARWLGEIDEIIWGASGGELK